MDVLGVAAAADGRPDLTASVAELGNLRMTNLLVEGGQAIHGTFHDAGLIDEVYAFIAPKLVVGTSAPSPMGEVKRVRSPRRAVCGTLSCRRWVAVFICAK